MSEKLFYDLDRLFMDAGARLNFRWQR